MLLKTAAIVIIGNEILSGKVRDENSYYLACELRKLGVDVKEISVIPDEIGRIGGTVSVCSEKYDFVFTTGGVGPTHDDVTMAGIAQGFRVPVVEHPDLKKILHEWYDDEVSGAVLKMAGVPEGSSIEFHSNIRFPIVSFRNIYIFPGIPEYLKKKFPLLTEILRSPGLHLKRIFLNMHESRMAGHLNSLVDRYHGVLFGSYPVTGRGDYRLIVTAESISEELLQEAVDELINTLPDNALVTIKSG